MRSTDRLLGDLVATLQPIRPVPRLRVVTGWALFLGAVSCLAVVLFAGLRPGLAANVLQPSVGGVAAGLLGVALGAIAASIGSAVPGREWVARVGVCAAVGGLALAGGAAGWGIVSAGLAAGEGLGLGCLGIALVGGLLPSVPLVVFLSQALPRRPAAAAATAAGGAVAIGALSVQATCPAAAGLHVLVGHALAPVLSGAVLAVLLYAILARAGPGGSVISRGGGEAA